MRASKVLTCVPLSIIKMSRLSSERLISYRYKSNCEHDLIQSSIYVYAFTENLTLNTDMYGTFPANLAFYITLYILMY